MHIQDILKLFDVIDSRDFLINKFETNSKLVAENDVFIAINNGINYINEAIENGARAVIVEGNNKYECITINVNSSIEALGRLGQYLRGLYCGKVIAITGSCGKTTTKELVSAILEIKYNVLKSERNYNNHIGVPLTLLKLNNNYDFAILELGMNHKGEIKYLSNICKPDYGVITNIGTAHIGNLGSIKNIYKAKTEMLPYLNNSLYVNNLKVKYKKTIYANKKSLNAKNIKYYLDRTEFDVHGHHFVFNIPGEAALNDLFIAMMIGINMHIDISKMCECISNFRPLDGRLNVIYKDYIIIDDSYNSSYESLLNSLKIIKKSCKHKIIVLGDMLELGKYSKKYHLKINRYLQKIKNKEVLLIGNYTKYIKGKHFNNVDEIIDYINIHIKEGNILYIKGSRAMQLDKIKTRL